MDIDTPAKNKKNYESRVVEYSFYCTLSAKTPAATESREIEVPLLDLSEGILWKSTSLPAISARSMHESRMF